MFRSRVAGAPISWGVCEAPGWGYQLPAERVLSEMRAIGLSATEFGPVGFLAQDPGARAKQLQSAGLSAVGGFLPVVLHDPTHDPLPEVDRFVDDCLAAQADVVVLAAASGDDGYDARPVLDDSGWQMLLSNLDRIDDHTRSRGLTASMHPHVGTMVEQRAEVARVLSGSGIGICVDTGHLALGGYDAVDLVADHAERVTHVHLKDVDLAMAAHLGDGGSSFTDGVRAGLFKPLGQGDIDIVTLVKELEHRGYRGWYVLEQDVMLDGDPSGAGPVTNVRESLDFLLGTVA